MHLHSAEEPQRGRGLGTEFVRRSVEEYFGALELKRLFCQPNAYNVAPNRTLQRAGFRYVLSAEMAPSVINPPQPITRWVYEPAAT
jgi:RimJ/RimL family protein N-acetyltransferase